MRFEIFDETYRKDLLELLAPSLVRLSEDQPTNQQAPFTLHESCRVMFLDLPADLVVDSLASFVRPVEVWHHQIHANGAPLYFARTRTDKEGSHLVEVTRSPWAERFAESLPAVEQIKEPPGEELIVRLLVVPRFGDFSFGVFRQAPTGLQLVRVLPLEEAVRVTGPQAEAAPRETDEGGYLAHLRGLPSAVGIQS